MKIGNTLIQGQPLANELTSERQPASDNTTATKGVSLAPGSLLKGLILSTTEDGKLLLSVGGKELTAQSLVPLNSGQEIWLEVLKNGDVPTLGQAERKGAVVDFMRFLFTNSRTMQQENSSLIQKLAAAVKNSLPQAQPQTTAAESPLLQSQKSTTITNNPTIQTPVTKSGQTVQFFAQSILGPDPDIAKLIKTMQLLTLFSGQQETKAGPNIVTDQNFIETALALLATEADKTTTDTAPLKEVGSLTKMIEAFARLNHPAEHSPQEFILLPCFFANKAGWGEWMFSFDQHGNDEGKPTSYDLSFFLDMSNLGEIHLQVNIQRDALRGIFSLTNSETRDYLAQNLPELNEILERLDFHPVNLSCQTKSEGNLQRLKQDLTSRVGLQTFSLLDVTI